MVNCKILQNIFLSSVEMFHCEVSLRMARFQNLVKGKDKGLQKSIRLPREAQVQHYYQNQNKFTLITR